MILRCTRKLLDVIKPGTLAGQPGNDEDWYGNLLWTDGRKCLLLTHAGTLFTIFEPDVRAAGLRDTGGSRAPTSARSTGGSGATSSAPTVTSSR